MDQQTIFLLASFAIAAVATIPGERDWTHYTFDQYAIDFPGSYDQSENLDRASIFYSNLARINAHNADPSKTWFASVNEFTAWTNQEFRQKRAHGTRSHQNMRDSRDSGSLPTLDSLPDSIDWRMKAGVVTPVKNQGGCGSCWAFSATETIESALAIATGKPAPKLSPQQIVSCAPNPQKCGGSGGCDGSTQELAFQYTEGPGLTSESAYPYAQETGTCDQSKIKAVAKNAGFVKLPTNNYTALLNAVANIGPIAISVAAGSMGWQLYGGGVWGGNCGFDQDHAVQLVGYGTDNAKDYWLVRNSWGAGWGEEGYIRIQRFGEGKEPCGMDTTPGDGSACAGDTKPLRYCGLCGILSDSSYPTGVTEVSPGPSPSPKPPSPSPPGPPSPAPSPSPPTPSGCEDAEDYCTHPDIFQPEKECEFEAKYCMRTCGCCDPASAPSYCTPSDTIVV